MTNKEKNHLKDYFIKQGARDAHAPDLTDEELRLFVAGQLEGDRLESVLSRLAHSPADQELVAALRKRMNQIAEAENEIVPPALLDRVLKDAARGQAENPKCPHCGGAITSFKSPLSRQKRLLWVWGALAVSAFLLSFVFRGYFLQCLAVAVLAGVKWIVDNRSLKSQILIYRALEEPLQAPSRGNLHPDKARL